MSNIFGIPECVCDAIRSMPKIDLHLLTLRNILVEKHLHSEQISRKEMKSMGREP